MWKLLTVPTLLDFARIACPLSLCHWAKRFTGMSLVGTTPTSSDVRDRSAVEVQGDVQLKAGDFVC
jgi:hypothetical protein